MAKKSNCLIWAILLYRRRKRKNKNCYLSFRGSRLARYGFHTLFMEKRFYGVRIISYSPKDKREIKNVLEQPVFYGYAKWGD